MTRYTVLWEKSLENHFIDAWGKSDSTTRGVLTEVANWVDNELSLDPTVKGQQDPIDPDLRLLEVPTPEAQVAVVYQCMPSDCIVTVVRLIFKRPVT